MPKLEKSSKVGPEDYFWLSNGKSVKSLSELAAVLRKLDKKTIQHHVTSDRNDFVNWIRDVYKDRNLAERVMKAKTKVQMSNAILKSLKLESLKNMLMIKQMPIKIPSTKRMIDKIKAVFG